MGRLLVITMLGDTRSNVYWSGVLCRPDPSKYDYMVSTKKIERIIAKYKVPLAKFGKAFQPLLSGLLSLS